MKYTVYKITNNIDGKIYIGVHKTKNIDDDYMGSGKYLKRAINKHGIENFAKEILACFDNPDDMFNMESELVNEGFVKRKDTYNIKEGGFGGWDYINENCLTTEFMTERGKKGYEAMISSMDDESWSKSHKKAGDTVVKNKSGIHHPDYVNNSMLGKHHTEETKSKIGAASSIHQKGKKNSQYGTCWINCPYTHKSFRIPRFDLKEWEDKGYVKGARFKNRI
jgi:hypothetical protein